MDRTGFLTNGSKASDARLLPWLLGRSLHGRCTGAFGPSTQCGILSPTRERARSCLARPNRVCHSKGDASASCPAAPDSVALPPLFKAPSAGIWSEVRVMRVGRRMPVVIFAFCFLARHWLARYPMLAGLTMSTRSLTRAVGGALVVSAACAYVARQLPTGFFSGGVAVICELLLSLRWAERILACSAARRLVLTTVSVPVEVRRDG
jgi:hypothetical protein